MRWRHCTSTVSWPGSPGDRTQGDRPARDRLARRHRRPRVGTPSPGTTPVPACCHSSLHWKGRNSPNSLAGEATRCVTFVTRTMRSTLSGLWRQPNTSCVTDAWWSRKSGTVWTRVFPPKSVPLPSPTSWLWYGSINRKVVMGGGAPTFYHHYCHNEFDLNCGMEVSDRWKVCWMSSHVRMIEQVLISKRNFIYWNESIWGGILYLTNLFLHTKLFFVLVYFPHVSSKVLKDNMAKITMWRKGVIISGVSEPRRWMKGEGCALGNSAQIVTYRTVNVQGVGNACYTHYASGTQVTRHVLLSGM